MKTFMSALMLVGALALSACSSSQETAGGEKAVMCPKCQTVWVTAPQAIGARTRVYTANPQMVCAACTAAAEKYLATGDLGGVCGECGTGLKKCDVHE